MYRVRRVGPHNAIGNILTKSDVGTYAYPEPGQPFPHAVSLISGSLVNTTFSYDANGNQTSGNGLTLTYASFNKPATIARGSALISFAHDPEHQRFRQMSSTGETLYLAGSGVMAERLLGSGGVVQWTNYLSAGGELIGMRVDRSDATTYTRYFHKDHLGSIATITDASGAVVERLSYDAWGKRRFPNGQDDPSGSIASQTTRGFTRHEQLADVGLVHMNGRVYDPMLGRFGTPDPTTENPFSSQGWNRYTYVGNSPLNFTDPSGYCFAGCFWQKPFKALGALLRRAPIIGQILTVAAGLICGPACSSIASAVVTGLASGNLGLALKAGLISAATAAAFAGIGDLTGSLGLEGIVDPELGGHGPLEFVSDAHIFNIAGHAAVGCAFAVASGGKCGPGAASGAVGSFATPLTNDLSFEAGLAVTTTAGGLASVAGGGKFGNGAVTAAFGYLYNEFGNNRERGYEANLPRNMPAGVDVMGNAAIAANFDLFSDDLLGDYWFYKQVRNRGPWDYKQIDPSLYEDFGNFNFGAVGAAFGFSEDTLTRMAGWAQVRGGNVAGARGVAPYMINGLLGMGGVAPYQDDWNDQYWIKQGVQYYKENSGKF